MKIHLKRTLLNLVLAVLLFPALPSAMFGAEGDAKSNSGAAASEESIRLATIHYGTETEISSLIQALRNEGSGSLDEELITLVQSTRNRTIIRGVFSFFGERNKSGLEERAIRAIEERDDETNDTIQAAVDYLGKVKARDAVDPLKELINTRERRFMNNAIRALGRAGGRADGKADSIANDTAEYLVDLFSNEETADESRREILSALGETGSKRGVPFLAELAENNEERSALRIAALESLARIADDDGLEAILAAVGDADPNIRSTAVTSLGPFKGAAVDKAILEAFRDSYYRTRIGAAQASRERKLEEAIPYLKYRAEKDDVPQVKDESLRALGAIGSREAMSILETFFTERKGSDRVRIISAEMLMKNDADKYLDKLVVELDEAKTKNQTALYNGFLKVAGESKTGKLDSLARRFLESGGIIEKSYALDIAANNNLRNLSREITPLTEDKNASLARKAKVTLEKLGIKPES
ncbi:PBS lyase [Spirochaetia bacterium]|nr:PBS lyase [Spirochaetia bacterium]